MSMLIKLKRGQAASWTEQNPVLAPGEPGYEIDTGKLKIGNGIDHWIDLKYTGEDPRSVYDAETHYDFPSIGDINVIYKANKEKKIYQWNVNQLFYEELSADSNSSIDIEIINGGKANGIENT